MSDGHEEDQVALFEFALADGVAKAERNGAGGGVGVAVDIDHDFIVG